MAEQHCYTDADGCRVCDEVPPTNGSPPRIEHNPVLGWNASANSVSVLNGNVRLTWRQPDPPTDAVLGLRASTQRGIGDTNPYGVLHGFRLLAAGAGHFAAVWDRGNEVSARIPYTLDDVFEVSRVGGAVVYRINGREVHRSTAATTAALIATGCLYRSGDALPSGCTEEA